MTIPAAEFHAWPRWTPQQAAPQLLVMGETVVDAHTGLTWTRAEAPTRMNRTEAMAYCDALELGGLSDWRLPTMTELLSSVDYSRVEPAANAEIFPVVSFGEVNEGGPVAHVTTLSGTVLSMTTGAAANTDTETRMLPVRCVRSMETPRDVVLYTLNETTVVDNVSGLTWGRSVANAMDHAGAVAFCTAAGGRLPTLREMFSIIRWSELRPSIHDIAFPNTPDANYWTSTTVAAATGNQWVIHSYAGGMTTFPPDYRAQARCVF